MASKVKYMNSNNYPVFIPDARGGQVMFRPGEGTTKQWFSRFTGRGQLTAVSLNAKEISQAKQVLDIKNTKIDLAPPPEVKQIEVPLAFENEDYTFNKGIYTCKLCKGIFRTGSVESMHAHIVDFHGKRDSTSAAVGSRQSGTEAAILAEKQGELKETTTTTTIPKTDAPPVIADEKDEEEFACDVPGCGKVFTSGRGLNMHKMRMHK